MSEKYTAVLFSAGLDSAVLLADALARRDPGETVQALHVSVGFAWEEEERAMAARLFAVPPCAGRTPPPLMLSFDMRDVFPETHWAMRGTPPGFDTPDEDVFLDGRNLILTSKAGVFVTRAARPRHSSARLLIGTLAGNPFPDATPEFLEAQGRALSLGLDLPLTVEAPFATRHKSDVVRRGLELGVPLELTLSCMQPEDGLHCGRCSKCRERRDAFLEAAVQDPTAYRERPLR
jgi:7-cyano-7-deazaguanine synthase